MGDRRNFIAADSRLDRRVFGNGGEFVSACAQAHGCAHDAMKLRASYRSYGAKQGTRRAPLTEIAKSYEPTYRSISDLGGQKVTVQQQIAHR